MTNRKRSTPPRKSRSRQSKGSLPAPPALELAKAFIRDFHRGDPRERKEAIVAMVLGAGELICETAGPGRWDALDPAELLARMPTATPDERVELCLHLIGFTSWLAANGYVDPDLPPAAARAVVATEPTEPILLTLCRGILSA